MDPYTIVKSYKRNFNSLEDMAEELDGGIISINVTGPSGGELCGRYAVVEDYVFIDLAKIAKKDLGEDLLLEETSSIGIGEMILDGLDRGYRNYVLKITNNAADDLGIGMLEKLGFAFLDDFGNPTYNFARVKEIQYENMDKRLKDTDIKIICDDTYAGGLSSSIERYLNGKYI